MKKGDFIEFTLDDTPKKVYVLLQFDVVAGVISSEEGAKSWQETSHESGHRYYKECNISTIQQIFRKYGKK
ncbi:MAG: hypothetical protein WC783_00580 [Candidatus Paceibacterota bacterium]|jgi:hypothetical protein